MGRDNAATAKIGTLETLTNLKQALIALDNIPARATYQKISQYYDTQLQARSAKHRQRKKERDLQRQYYREILSGERLNSALQQLDKESQQDGIERKRLKRERNEAIAPFAEAIAQANYKMLALKQQYTSLSRVRQADMQAAYLAARSDHKALGFPIVYKGSDLIVINKPAGLLSVPGRQYHLQDSVLSRLRSQSTDHSFLQPVHRLDQATSGLMMVATSAKAHAALSQQFANRQVHKRYEAILSQPVEKSSGKIELPLWNNPDSRPKQLVNAQHGKSSHTDFRLLTPGDFPRVEFTPHTGRTHQLRVHAAHPDGLNSPIMGDTLYGRATEKGRLMLHATVLEFVHPITQKSIQLSSDAPFMRSPDVA